MSASTIDYDALAAQHGGTVHVDYDALAAQHGGSVQQALDLSNKQGQGVYQMAGPDGKAVPVPYGQVQQAAEQGYQFAADQEKFRYAKDNAADPHRATRFAPAQGDPRASLDYQQQMEQNLPAPMQAVAGIAKGGGTLMRPVADVVAKAVGASPDDVSTMLRANGGIQTAAKVGTIGAALAPAVAAAPTAAAGGVVGGTLGAGAGQFIGDVAGMKPENTQLLSDALGAAGGAAGAVSARPAMSALDFSAKKEAAGALLRSVAHDANQVPVDLENTQDAALRMIDWQKKTQLGPTVNKFLNRITSPKQGPMTYEEARGFYQVLGNLSADEKLRMPPPVKRDLVQMVVGLKQDIGDAADQVGKAADYYQGMQDYAKAAKFQEWYDAAKKWAIPAALGAAGMAGAKRLLSAYDSVAR